MGIHVSHNKRTQDDLKFYKTIKDLCNVIKLWCIRKLSLESKVTTFKSLTISKIVSLEIITHVPSTVTEELNQIQKNF